MNEIRKYRKNRGLTQSKLAKELGTDQRRISVWENGKAPEYIQKLFTLLNEANGFK